MVGSTPGRCTLTATSSPVSRSTALYTWGGHVWDSGLWKMWGVSYEVALQLPLPVTPGTSWQPSWAVAPCTVPHLVVAVTLSFRQA